MTVAFATPRRIATWGTATILLTLLAGVAVDRLRSREQSIAVATALTKGDPALAPPIFRRYGCTGCHTIPGVPGADGKVAARLEGLRSRVYIAGTLNNTGDALVSWIVSPQRFQPDTAMPATGITEPEARHLAAYLYAH
ncbi:cytochrome C [Rhizobium sp. NFR03]|uniref:c-type cytochrome n=1 Tax=Rhizobium sp. NFR03 TaxID=1566263 RepID=UPI0008D894FF|nr:cytochrome C [Rhizobium sp. NFR03]SES22383.1 Cytochrome c2 [Rhizobium sp. NFR03]